MYRKRFVVESLLRLFTVPTMHAGSLLRGDGDYAAVITVSDAPMALPQDSSDKSHHSEIDVASLSISLDGAPLAGANCAPKRRSLATWTRRTRPKGGNIMRRSPATTRRRMRVRRCRQSA